MDVKCTKFSTSVKVPGVDGSLKKKHKVRYVDVKWAKFSNNCWSAWCGWQFHEKYFIVRYVDVNWAKFTNICWSAWCGWQFLKKYFKVQCVDVSKFTNLCIVPGVEWHYFYMGPFVNYYWLFVYESTLKLFMVLQASASCYS